MTSQIEQHKAFRSKHVEARNVDVWLPPSYAAADRRRYGVLYMHDGQNLFNPETAYIGVDWGVVPALERLIPAGDVPELLVVGVWNTEARTREYLPQRPFASPQGREMLRRRAADFGGPPVSDAYLRFLVEEVKPFIDDRYRTRPGRADTFVMGSSMGGLVSLYALCQYPELFAGVGCLSTHWPAVEGVMLDYLAEALPPAGRHRIYFDYGTETLDAVYEPFQQDVDALMAAAGYRQGVDWITRRFEGAVHSETSWRERVHIPLAFLLGAHPV
jgi:predicted alpha/beta superfamily hydrolase